MRRKKKKKVLYIPILIIVITIAITIGFYYVITLPKEYEINNLKFKLPYNFYQIPYYEHKYGLDYKPNKPHCNFDIVTYESNQQLYEEKIIKLTSFYVGSKSIRIINGTSWIDIKKEFDGTDIYTKEILVTLVNSYYYQVTIDNNMNQPCSEKNINDIINSLSFEKNNKKE